MGKIRNKMNFRFKTLSIFEFQERFNDQHSCQSLSRWIEVGKAFRPLRCGYTKYCEASWPFES
jgi:hypothetical protein